MIPRRGASLHGRLWALGARLLAPALPAYLRRRARRGKEIPERLAERLGHGGPPPGAARPPGPLLWLHAASVGETTSILPVVEALLAPGLTAGLAAGPRDKKAWRGGAPRHGRRGRVHCSLGGQLLLPGRRAPRHRRPARRGLRPAGSC
jgi:hypothetical protein